MPSLAWSALSPRAAVVLAVVVTVVALVVVLLGARQSAEAPREVTVRGATPSASGRSAAAPAPPSTAATVVVHVAGAVADAGIVTLPSGSRVAAAVERAGGAARDADLGRLNLARPVVDGERVYVPRVGEEDPAPGASGTVAPSSGGGAGGGTGSGAGVGTGPGGTVDLNSADATTLETLPGIGPALAARIIAWREEHGRFTTVEDLLDVSGIGDAKFADLQDRVRV